MRPARAYAYAGAGIVFLLLATLIANITARGIFINEYVDDLYFVFDASWRIKSGQVPHVDFISPIGQAFYWPFALLLKILPYSAKTILWANMLVAALLSLVAWTVLRRRLSPLLFFLAVASIILGILSPRDADSFTGNVFSYLAPYNRWSWGFLAIVTYLSLIPPGSSGKVHRDSAVDGVALGLLLIALAYLKITYFAGGMFLLGVGFFSGALGLRSILISALVFFLGAATIELLFHNTAGYFRDLLYAVSVSRDQTDSWRIQKFWPILRLAAAYLALVLALSVLASGSWRGLYGRPVIMGAVAILAGAGIAYQNHSARETNLYVAGIVVFAEFARRAVPDRHAPNLTAAQSGPLTRLVNHVPAIGTAIAAAIFTVVDASSIIRETIATRDGSACFLPELQGTSLAGFMQSPRALEGTARKFDARGSRQGRQPTCRTANILQAGPSAPDPAKFHLEPAMLSDLMAVLRKTLVKSDRLLVMEFANPYSAIFKLEPARGDVAWWDESRTISHETFPAPDRLLESPTVIVQLRSRRSLLWDLYGDAIQARYQVAAETPWWRVWRRRKAYAHSQVRLADDPNRMEQSPLS